MANFKPLNLSKKQVKADLKTFKTLLLRVEGKNYVMHVADICHFLSSS